MTGIHGLEAEDVAEKRAVRFSIFAEDNYVSARNHCPLLRNARNPWHSAYSLDSENSIKFKFRKLATVGSQFPVVTAFAAHRLTGSRRAIAGSTGERSGSIPRIPRQTTFAALAPRTAAQIRRFPPRPPAPP